VVNLTLDVNPQCKSDANFDPDTDLLYLLRYNEEFRVRRAS
jgi:hypothetical protein